jgi:hypothetical protein
MSELETITGQIRSLPLNQVIELEDWLVEFIEEQGELNPEFVASIERGKSDLREGRVRVRKP